MNNYSQQSEMVPSSQPTSTQSGSRWWLIVVVVILLGAIAYGVFAIWQPFRMPPQQILEAAITNTTQWETYQSDIELTLNATSSKQLMIGSTGGAQAITANINASIKEKPRGSKGEISFKVNTSGIGPVGIPLSIAGVLRHVEDEAYIRADDLSFLGSFLQAFGGQDITGQWIKLPTQQGTSTEILGQDTLDKFEKELLPVIRENPPLEIVQQKEPQSVRETPCYHYVVKLNKENVIPVAMKVFELSSSEFEQVPELTEEKKQDAREEIQQVLQNYGDLTMEVWISKENHFIRRLRFGSKEQPVSLSKNFGFIYNRKFTRLTNL